MNGSYGYLTSVTEMKTISRLGKKGSVKMTDLCLGSVSGSH